MMHVDLWVNSSDLSANSPVGSIPIIRGPLLTSTSNIPTTKSQDGAVAGNHYYEPDTRSNHWAVTRAEISPGGGSGTSRCDIALHPGQALKVIWWSF